MNTLRIGNTDVEVTLLKEYLGQDVDNMFFDEKTEINVKGFQKANDLTADGIVGYNTWEKLMTVNRTGSKELTEKDYVIAANLLDCEVASIKAVAEVETGGKGGFLDSGDPTILFEGHVFWSQLKQRGIDPSKHVKGNEDILYQKWTKAHYKGGQAEYDRLNRAIEINEEAADCSASWGMFQIMGLNYQACGEKSVYSFVAANRESEYRQLLLFARFIRSNGLLASLQGKKWAEFARKYNGSGYAKNKYDVKLEEAYRKHA